MVQAAEGFGAGSVPCVRPTMTGKWMRLHEQHLCIVCGDPKRPCQPWDRNTDGTYAHAECLRPHSLRVAAKTG